MFAKISVKKPYTVLVGVVLVIVLGIVSFMNMTADLLPNINLPYVVVMTTYVGASPETVEMVVTKPVESAMATVSNIESITSTSSENYSAVILEFSQTTNMDSVSLEIREKLDQLKSYWDDSVGNPIIMKLNPDMLPVMIAAVGVEGMENNEVTDYVNNIISPALESIEGVASVSATGLIEESVNVVIRQDKIDALNEKVHASIDEKMADAEKELADGREEIEKNQKDLDDAKQKIVDGKAEIQENKDKLADGKNELENKKNEMSTQLAQAQTQLLTAKADAEAAKTSLTMEIEVVKKLAEGYNTAKTAKDALEALPGQLTVLDSLSEVEQRGFVSALPAGEMKTAVEGIVAAGDAASQDWTITWVTVKGAVNVAVTTALDPDGELMKGLEKAKTALDAKTMGMEPDAYIATLNSQLGPINDGIAKVDAGLTELSKGNLTAAIEFANASTQITLGESQIASAEAQIEASETQIETGMDQLKSALEQLEDGEEQLADAKNDAYDSADMTDIITVDTIKGLLTAQNFSMPAGYVTEDGISYMVRVGDKPSDADEMRDLPLMNLHMDGIKTVHLGDVADVFYTDNSEDVYTNVNGANGVLLTIQKQTGYSTGEVSDRLLEKFEELKEENPNLELPILMDQGVYIDLVMDSIFNNIIVGAALAILILILFLRDIKPTFIIAVSIPISLVTAIVCMYFAGVTLNIISLSGLALGIGMLVDNSIVVIENIYRMRSEGKSMKEAAIEGTLEVGGAILASTLTTVCVFLPIVFTKGITRQLFVDMGLTIGFSLMASLVIALTVVPAMASGMLKKTKNVSETKLLAGLINGYEKFLEMCLRFKPIVILVTLALFGVSAYLSISKGTAFMPDMDSTQVSINVVLADDATLNDTRAVCDTLVERIAGIEEVMDVGAMVGGGNVLSLTGGSDSVNTAAAYVTLDENKERSNEEIAKEIRDLASDLQAEITVDTSSMDMSALGGSGISVMIKGRDLDELTRIAKEVGEIVEGVEGTAEVSNGLEDSAEELRITIDKEKAMEYGLTVAQVFSQIQPKLAEATSSTTLEEADKDRGVFVLKDADKALTRDSVKKLMLTGTGEESKSVDVKLSEIASFEAAYTPTTINRSAQSRYITVSAGVAEGHNIGLVAKDVEEALSDYELPAGYSMEYSGENETIMDAMEQLLLMLLLAIVFMYLIMVAQFQSLLYPFIIMFTIPLAFTGGFLALFVSNSEVSVIALIGFVMLSGIIVNNGIVIVDYMNQLRAEGMNKKEAILKAGTTRLRPVLMTALTTILAMSTMVFSHDMGSEMARPMALVTVGGLLYGTLLTLIVVPCIYDIFTGKEKRKHEKAE